MSVDRIFTNGRVLHMAADAPEFADSVATSGGRVVAVGSADEVMVLRSRGTEVVDLERRFVTPGFIDTHTHVALYGIRSTAELDLRSPAPATIEELLARLSSAAGARPPGSWIRGGGWTEAMFGGRAPSRYELDQACPDNPVVLTHATGHLLAANSAALAIAGINASTSVTAGSEIERDDHGQPTGVLREFAAMDLLTSRLPPLSDEEWEKAILWAQDRFLEEGVTSCKESYSQADYPQVVATYRRLARGGRLRLRPTVLRQVDSPEAAKEAVQELSDEDGVRERGLKVYLDGSLVARTAWLTRAYVPSETAEQDSVGEPTMAPDTLNSIVDVAGRAGADLAVHAIGDRAVQVAVEAIQSTQGAVRAQAVWSVVHALLVSPASIKAMAQAGVAVETQPIFLTCLGAGYRRVLDRKRLARLIPMRSLWEAGVTIGSGSDMPTCTPAARRGLHAACARPSPEEAEVAYAAEERLTRRQAIATYTSSAARCLGMEGTVGSLRAGSWADFVIWDSNLVTAPDDELAEARPIHTVIAAESAWRRDAVA